MIVQLSCGHPLQTTRTVAIGDPIDCGICSPLQRAVHQARVTTILRVDAPAPTPRAIPNSERIQAIRDNDAAAGENLQMAPSAWQDRRDLLTLLDSIQAPRTVGVLLVEISDQYGTTEPAGVYTSEDTAAQADAMVKTRRTCVKTFVLDAEPDLKGLRI